MVTQGRSNLAAFRALADPTRRAILELLQHRKRTVGDIAQRFPMSRPAISKHLRILKEAALVAEDKAGRERIYRLTAGPLSAVGDWVASLGATSTRAPVRQKKRTAKAARREPSRPKRSAEKPRIEPPSPPAVDPDSGWRQW